MAERKSAPRKAEVKLDEEAQKRRERYLLLMLLTGAVAVVLGMILVSGFLSNNSTNRVPLLVGLGATVALGAVFYLMGHLAGRRKA